MTPMRIILNWPKVEANDVDCDSVAAKCVCFFQNLSEPPLRGGYRDIRYPRSRCAIMGNGDGLELVVRHPLRISLKTAPKKELKQQARRTDTGGIARLSRLSSLDHVEERVS